MFASKPQIINLIQDKLGVTEDKSSDILDYLIFYIHKSLDNNKDLEETMLEIIRQALENDEELIETAVEFFNQANEQNIAKAITACA